MLELLSVLSIFKSSTESMVNFGAPDIVDKRARSNLLEVSPLEQLNLDQQHQPEFVNLKGQKERFSSTQRRYLDY